MDDDPVDIPTRFDGAVVFFFLTVLNQRQHQIIACSQKAFRCTGDEIAEDGVHHFMLFGQRDNVADRHSATGRKAFGAHVRGVVIGARSGLDTQTCGFLHLGIAVQRAAYRGLRQVQVLCEFFKVHTGFQSAFKKLVNVWHRRLGVGSLKILQN